MAFNTKIFDVKFKTLVVWLFPKPTRKPVHISWLWVAIDPLMHVYEQLLAFRDSVLYFLSITPQVCRLEKLLNDRYDSQLRRIRIVDGVEYDPIWLYTKMENKPVALYCKSEDKPVWLYTKAETGATAVDFIIQVPQLVAFDMNELVGLVKRFKLPSKNFKVQLV